jgi:cytoskeletal protein CcmA (bactofilin family)
MGWRTKNNDGKPTTGAIENILGRSLVVHGDLKADGSFRVDGLIEGSVDSQAVVVIGESGVIEGNVHGKDVVVAGQVRGDIFATGHLEIVASGTVEGDIEAQSVRIEKGGVYRGTSRMGAPNRVDAKESPLLLQLPSGVGMSAR